jgi:hypothetical protein
VGASAARSLSWCGRSSFDDEVERVALQARLAAFNKRAMSLSAYTVLCFVTAAVMILQAASNGSNAASDAATISAPAAAQQQPNSSSSRWWRLWSCAA